TIDAGQSRVSGLDQGMIDRRNPGIALALELGQAEPHRLWPDVVDVIAYRRRDRLGILVRHQPATDLRRGPGRDDRLRPRTPIAAPDAVDVERRPGPVALGRRKARFAMQGLEPVGLLQGGFVERHARELPALLFTQ